MTLTEEAAIVLQEIAAALALAEKATPGPWHTGNERLETTNFVYRTLGQNMARGFSINVFGTVDDQDKADAAFIAASRTLLPTALEIIRDDIKAWLALSIDQHAPAYYQKFCEGRLTNLINQWEARK